MAAVGAWPVPRAPYCRGGGVAGPVAPNDCREGVAGPPALYGLLGGVASSLVSVAQVLRNAATGQMRAYPLKTVGVGQGVGNDPTYRLGPYRQRCPKRKG